MVAMIAVKRPHAADKANHPNVESSPSHTVHFPASAVWANALAGNWWHSHLNPPERPNPDPS